MFRIWFGRKLLLDDRLMKASIPDLHTTLTTIKPVKRCQILRVWKEERGTAEVHSRQGPQLY
jgi:hypothetical protein